MRKIMRPRLLVFLLAVAAVAARAAESPRARK